MTYIIAGASSGLGRALAERFASGGCDLVLVSRDLRDTAALARHLMLKYEVKVSPVEIDFCSDPLCFDAIDESLSSHLPLKGLLMPIGANDMDDTVGLCSEKLDYISTVNYLAPCKLLNHYLPTLEKNAGLIAGFGSVASARGRRRNAAYSAAKRALDSYFESLAHYAANRAFSSQYYILGYLDTNLAFSQDLIFPVATPERIADVVYRRRFMSGRLFLPRHWYMIYRILQFLPWTIFRRLSF